MASNAWITLALFLICVMNASQTDSDPAAQPERGSFKIDDGDVIGGGTYEINADGVDVDIKLKIAPGAKPGPTPASLTTTAQAPSPVSKVIKPEGRQPSNQTTPTASDGGGSDNENEGLNEHNKFRRVHGVPLLTLNSEMSQQAAAYAKKIAEMGSLQHSSKEERNANGENLSYGCSSNKGQTIKEAVTNWYNEVCDPGYTFGTDSGAGGTGHFTQVIWKETTELGIGKADIERGGMKCAFIVGRYKTAGNMMGTFADNAPKGSFNTSYCSTT